MSGSVIHTSRGAQPLAAYSQGFVAGPFVFTAGAVPIDPATGKLAGNTIERQTRQVFSNVAAVLAAGSTNFAEVVKVNVYLHDMKLHDRFQRVFAKYFPDRKPAVTIAGISLDALPGMLVEFECIAYRGEG